MAMAKEARAYGAEIAERTEVIGFELDESGRRVVAVETKGGDRIVCNSAVLCGGAWTKELSKRAFGENRIAVAMMPHQYAIFDRTEGVGGTRTRDRVRCNLDRECWSHRVSASYAESDM